MTVNVIVTYDEYCEGTTREPYEDDEWDRGDDSWSFSVDRVFGDLNEAKRRNSWMWEQFEIEVDELPKEVYVVWVRYSTGDTFGSSTGRGTVEGVYLTQDEAKRVAESIRTDKYEEENPGKYPCWVGYFERLESVDWDVFHVY